MPDDATLQAMVIEELDWDPSFDAAHIGVTARNGVVTLSGFVESYAAKAIAERAAGRVRGVKAIAEEIQVRLPSARKHADDEIAARAVQILAWDSLVPEGDIRVKVEHGLVTLTGTVGYQFQKVEAETDVRRLGGVIGVVNLIHVVPATGPSTDPATVEQRIAAALRRNAEIEASQIQVSADHGKVTLHGRVRTWLERSVVEHAAWAAPGVTDVKNELTIQP